MCAVTTVENVLICELSIFFVAPEAIELLGVSVPDLWPDLKEPCSLVFAESRRFSNSLRFP